MASRSRLKSLPSYPSHSNKESNTDLNHQRQDSIEKSRRRCRHVLCFIGFIVTILFIASVIIPLTVAMVSTSETKQSSADTSTILNLNTSINTTGITTSTVTTVMTSTSGTTTTETSTSVTTSTMTATTVTTTTSTTTITTTPYNCGASKPSSLGAPSGNANTTWTQFINTYTATKTNPVLMFGIDGATSIFALLDDVSVVDTSNPSVELLNNPSFESSLSSTIGWTTWCASSCSSGTAGNVTVNGCRSGICYIGSCNGGGVDYLAQRFSAIVGRTYNISFWAQRIRTGSGSASVTLYAGII